MRKEFVYSFMALGAIPVVVNAAEVEQISKDVLASATGEKVTYEVGNLLPGKYTFSAKVTSKVYDVEVNFGGVTKTVTFGTETPVSVELDLSAKTGETAVVLTLVSSDPNEPGADFSVTDAVVNLTFDLATIRTTLVNNAQALINTISGYNYAAKQEDVDAANDLKQKAGNLNDTYDDYKNNELYANPNKIQKDIDALAAAAAAKEAAFQNEKAYNEVNDAITAIKGKYNTAVADLKAKLVNEAAYLLDAALADLNTNINEEITEATQASYASYTGKTAVADKATNVGKIPTEEQINTIVNNWEGQAVTNQTAYNNLHAKVTGFQTRVNKVKPKSDGIAAAYPTTEAEAAITALNTKIENAKNSAAQLDLNVTTEETAAETKVSNLESKVAKANDEFDANKATTDAIAVVQKAYNDAKTAVDAKVSKDGDYKAADYYAAYLKTQQDAIEKLTSDAAAAYKVNGTGTAKAFNEGLAAKTEPITTAISAYQTNAIAAVGKYDDLQTAIASYQSDLNSARSEFEGLAIYEAEGYDYKTELDLIQKRINDIKKAITTAKGKVGVEHWTAMLDIDADAAITTDIANLLSVKDSQQNKYDAETLDKGIDALNGAEGRFAKFVTDFVPTGNTKLGVDYAVFDGIENAIKGDLADLIAAKSAIDPNSETVDYTALVGTEANDWSVAAGNNHNRAKLGNGQVEHYEGSGSPIGDMLWQEVEVENGIYDIEVLATSHRANITTPLEEDADDVAYVFGKSGDDIVKKFITARNNSGFAAGEPETYEIKGVKVENGKLTIGLALAKEGLTNWHTIQIKSLKANTASLIQGWGKKVADLNTQQAALERAADAVATKVAANTKAQSDLATSIDGLQDKINSFKTVYKLGQDDSTLGNRGKDGGSIDEAVDKIVTDLGTLETANNGVDPTAVTNVDKTDKFGKKKADWPSTLTYGEGENYAENNGTVESYKKTVEGIGVVLSQEVTGLANGIYDVVLTANANFTDGRGFNSDLVDGATDAAYVFANDKKANVVSHVNTGWTLQDIHINGVIVSDGTLKLGIGKYKAQTNWNAIQIKSLTYHENSQDATYNNDDPEALGYNDQYTALAKQEADLEKDAPNVKKAVENNAAANTAAQAALTTLGTYELDNLKNLADVSNAEGNFDTSSKDGNDINAKKSDPKGWAVFRSGLANDKNYQAKKNAIDALIAALTTAINDARDAEALPYPWADEITVVTTPDDPATEANEEVKTTYKISEIKALIDALKAEAADESANYWAYRNTSKSYFNVNIDPADITPLGSGSLDKAITQARTDLATVEQAVGEGAEPFYTGLIDSYQAKRNDIVTRMLASLNGRTAVADKEGFVNELKDLQNNKVKKIKDQATKNLAKYTEQKTAAEETQNLWNSTYTEIAATDQSSKVQDWLDELDAIQVKLTAATDSVEANYKVGKSVAEAKDFAAIKAAINDVKARQSATYNAQIAEDNKAAHETFMGNETTKGAIQSATEAYQKAVQERAKYSSTNEDVKATIDALAATLDEALFSAPTDIADLTKAENDAYVANSEANANLGDGELATPFDVDPFNTQATAFEQNITAELNTFKAGVKAALEGYWTPTKTALTGKVADAKTAIDGYSDAAKKDAFKDVEDLIKKADDGVDALKLSDIEDAIAALEDIDNMLAADKNAAAAKDITAASTAANKAYTDTKAYIEGKTIADDVNNVKTKQLQNLENAKTAADAALIDAETGEAVVVTADNHDTIKTALENVVTKANAAKTAVDTAIESDVANTAAYNDIIKALEPVEAKLAEAKAAAAPYKYETSFATVENHIKTDRTNAEFVKQGGAAVAYKDQMLNWIAGDNNDIDATLTTAFGTEKTGLAADITELKNQFNAYVAANGLNETATAFKDDIDDLEKALGDAAIADLDDPADGIQYDEILAATEALVKLQNDIADKQTELLAANGNAANAAVLADFQGQLNDLAAAASLEGYDEWVGQQEYANGKTYAEAVELLSTKIANLKAAIEAEPNISFYKDQYQSEINPIKALVGLVVEGMSTLDAKCKANDAVYTALSAQITELQGQIDAAKAKVAAYEYAANTFITYIEEYNAEKELIGGAQYQLSYYANEIEEKNGTKSLDKNYEGGATFGLNVTVKAAVKRYLDDSANAELNAQCDNLETLLTNAIDVKYKTQKYSSALWNRLNTEKGAISLEIFYLLRDIYSSHQSYEGAFDEPETAESEDVVVLGKYLGIYYYTLDEDAQIWKDNGSTSDADLEAQMAEVNRIKAEIETLSTAVDNLGMLGDANEDAKVNVLDYQKVVNMILDPTLQPDEDTNLFANVDINQNEIIEVGDLTAIVNFILSNNNNWQGYAAARGMNAESESIAMNISSLEQGKQRIAVSLANVSDYTAFQMDMVLPEGMTLVGTSLSNRAGESHKLYSRTQLDGSIRVLASSVKGETFSGNEGAVLYIDVEGAGSVELVNILFSDVNAQTHLFTIGGDATGINNVSTLDSLKQQVYDFGGRLMKGLKKGMNIIRRNDGGTDKVIVK